jgi:cyclophilin family peptidyl-prolyl cis-trans isomerase
MNLKKEPPMSTIPQTIRLAFVGAVMSSLAACGGGGGEAPAPAPMPPAAAPVCTASAAIPDPGATAPQVTLTLSNGAGVNGTVVLTLDAGRAPVTVANFLNYVSAGFYTGTVIHRHSPSFVLQGGGYAGPLVAGGTLPTLKTTNAPIVLEDNAGLSNLCLTVAMARTSVADSANSQYYINLTNNTFLDRTATARGYAVFGSVTAGSALVTAMTQAPCTAWSALLSAGECLPSPNITITSAVRTR